MNNNEVNVQNTQAENTACQNPAQECEQKHPGFVQMMPLVDILECADNVTMWFEIPGANSSTVKSEVKEKIMSIEAESSLRRNGKTIVFKREFQLSDRIDVEHITAKTKDGVLTLTLPKSESAKVHRIQVS